MSEPGGMKEPTLAEVLTASTTLAFLLTVAYGKGFSVPLGFSVFNYFTTNDYFRQAVEWLPSVVIVFICGCFLRILGPPPRPVPELRSEAKPNKREVGRKRLMSIIAAAGSVLTYIGVTFFIHLPDQLLYVGKAILYSGLWALMVELYVFERVVKLGWSRLFIVAFITLPPLLVVIFFKGAFDAEKAYGNGSTSTRVILNAEPQLLTGTILLSLDQFLILRDDDNQQVKVIPQSGIKQIIHDN